MLVFGAEALLEELKRPSMAPRGVGVTVVRAFVRYGAGTVLLQLPPEKSRFPNGFELAGGKRDPSDHGWSGTLVREVYEETGLEVVPQDGPNDPIVVYRRIMTGHRVGQEIRTITMQATVQDGEPRHNPLEHQGLVIATPAQAAELSLTDECRDALQNLGYLAVQPGPAEMQAAA
jgi:8-oxo-dGTP pyrophosphatase MutT (NUDIX family)